MHGSPFNSQATAGQASARANPSNNTTESVKQMKADLCIVTAKLNDVRERLTKAESKLTRLGKRILARREAVNAIMSVWRCSICCLYPLAQDLLVPQSCQRMAACRPCIDKWLGGSQSCPVCRSELTVTQLLHVLLIATLASSLEYFAEHDGEFSAV